MGVPQYPTGSVIGAMHKKKCVLFKCTVRRNPFFSFARLLHNDYYCIYRSLLQLQLLFIVMFSAALTAHNSKQALLVGAATGLLLQCLLLLVSPVLLRSATGRVVLVLSKRRKQPTTLDCTTSNGSSPLTNVLLLCH